MSPVNGQSEIQLVRRKFDMPKSSTTIANRIQRVLLEIAESPAATVEERLDALSLLSEVRGLAKQRDRATSRKQPKLASPAIGVLGTR